MGVRRTGRVSESAWEGKGTYVCGYVLGGGAVGAEGGSAGGWGLGCLRDWCRGWLGV